jgi:neutral ceramidase
MEKPKYSTLKYMITGLCMYFLFMGNMELKASQTPGFWAAAEKILITPKTPIPMSGYGSRKDSFKGIREEIHARVVVISDGTNKAAIISAEVIGFSHTFWDECTSLISKETGIPKEYILLTAVHNHSGPSLMVYEKAIPAVQDYVNELKTNLVRATKAAVNKLAPATIGAGKGECKMNINRVASDGKGGVVLGRNPYGSCDHEVGVLRINDKLGNPLAILVNWPCHAVVLGPRNYYITGDWPGAASGYIERTLGNGVISPMIIGASGDLNPIYGPHIDFEVTSSYAFGKDAIGEDLGMEAIRVSNNIYATNKVKINALQRIINLPLKDNTEGGNFQQPETVKDNSLSVRLSALRIGNIILTGVSGEVFHEISLKMRSHSPYPHTFMITHCNGSSGYLVTDKAFTVGGYEAKSTKARPGGERIIIENLLQMISEL